MCHLRSGLWTADGADGQLPPPPMEFSNHALFLVKKFTWVKIKTNRNRPPQGQNPCRYFLAQCKNSLRSSQFFQQNDLLSTLGAKVIDPNQLI